MNTLKMKVLLMIANTHLYRSLGRALLVWMLACITGCLALYLLDFFFLSSADELLPSIILSLAFSTPALVVAVGAFYFLHLLQGLLRRILFSATTILISSGVVIGIVSMYFNLPFIEVAKVLYPFVLSAFVYFFLIARKQLLVSYPI